MNGVGKITKLLLVNGGLFGELGEIGGLYSLGVGNEVNGRIFEKYEVT